MFQQPLWQKASAFKFGLAAGGVVVACLALIQSVLPLSLIPIAGGDFSTWLASLVGAAIGGMLVSGVVLLVSVGVRNSIVRARRRGTEPLEYSDGRWSLGELALSGFVGGALLFSVVSVILFVALSSIPNSSAVAVTLGALAGPIIVSGIMAAFFVAVVGACRNLLL